ncbi:MAG: fused MFS/spermidine synthase [Sterolibacteriaceae bacterium]|nr:fused MFS/spermidine synthase [Candidatus Methylophosphatis haderslevensis]
MIAARFISFWTGFCSLSLEIAWVRLYGYANNSTPKAFAYVLAIYLLGIAAGAQVGKRICRLPARGAIENAAVIALALCASIAAASPWVYLHSRQMALDDLMAPMVVFLTAASLSVLFPITHHLGTPQRLTDHTSAKGRHFSRVYVLNVLGAAFGPLVTGYVLLEYLTITQVFPALATVVAMVALSAWLMHGETSRKVALGSTMAGLTLALWFVHLGWQDPARLARSFATVGERTVVAMHESRHGIIAIAEEPATPRQPFVDHAVYGGNVYDGKVNVDLERNTNGLERPLALHVLQPKAKRVLVLGLSIGSWLTVVEGFPGVEEIDVIEINPGYLDLARKYDPQKRALEDPRVNIVVDDARRWLQYHRDRRYDLILMNTTWHWRANSSMLLSREMMQLVSRHLSGQGVVAFNATGSTDAFLTASAGFQGGSALSELRLWRELGPVYRRGKRRGMGCTEKGHGGRKAGLPRRQHQDTGIFAGSVFALE